MVWQPSVKVRGGHQKVSSKSNYQNPEPSSFGSSALHHDWNNLILADGIMPVGYYKLSLLEESIYLVEVLSQAVEQYKHVTNNVNLF